jgi:hypothetical protein
VDKSFVDKSFVDKSFVQSFVEFRGDGSDTLEKRSQTSSKAEFAFVKVPLPSVHETSVHETSCPRNFLSTKLPNDP